MFPISCLLLSVFFSPAALKTVPFTARSAKRSSRFFCDPAHPEEHYWDRERERHCIRERERDSVYVSIWGWWQLATPTHNQWDQLALWTFLISRCELMTSCFCYFIGQFVNRPGAWTPPDLWPLKFGFLFVAYSWCLNLKCLYWQSWWSCMLLTTNHRFWSDIKWHEQADLMSLC